MYQCPLSIADIQLDDLAPLKEQLFGDIPEFYLGLCTLNSRLIISIVQPGVEQTCLTALDYTGQRISDCWDTLVIWMVDRRVLQGRSELQHDSGQTRHGSRKQHELVSAPFPREGLTTSRRCVNSAVVRSLRNNLNLGF